MSFVTIQAAIKTKLDTLKGTGQPLVGVFEEHRTGLTKTGYPSATFEESNSQADYFSAADNHHIYAYEIYLHQEAEKVGRATARRILRQTVDSIISLFSKRSNASLGGACDFVEPVPAEFGEYDEGAGVVLYARIILKCHKLYDINS
jgi:hypothetical protein